MTKLLQVILYPVAWCYGLTMMIRNWLFDLHILPSKKFGIPVISIGNLTYGGTGKTPHIEYLIRLLSPSNKVATLSRGYGRKSNGFILASGQPDVKSVGDEPLQYFSKFKEVVVAVDEQRKRGIQLLLAKFPGLRAILLDDAFQHRHVKPGLSILLTDYHRLYPEDFILPSGTLREFRCGARRANIIVVTKTPRVFSPITRRRIIEDLRPANHQQVFFSYIKYLDPVPVFESQFPEFPPKVSIILLFTGIADDYPLREHLNRMCRELVVVKFADHHAFNLRDIEGLIKKFIDLPSRKKVMITTEKDVMRLKTPELSTNLKNLPLFYVPMEIDFHGTDKDNFDKEILSYVDKN
ncbi:MAG: tetraacyldisaccharide 4'-kinase [Bacteroidota bacterium]